jgi:hypothetical protein
MFGMGENPDEGKLGKFNSNLNWRLKIGRVDGKGRPAEFGIDC